MRAKPDTQKNIAPRITCTAPWRLKKVKPLANYTLEVEFVDGTHGFVEMIDQILGEQAGVFQKLKDVKLFNQVYLEYGVPTWPGELDLSPDAMHRAIKRYGKWVLK